MEWASGQLLQCWETALAFLAFDTARLLAPGMIVALILQVFLFLCAAFFSGSETALFSHSRLDLQKSRRDLHPRSDTLQALLVQPRRLIISSSAVTSWSTSPRPPTWRASWSISTAPSAPAGSTSVWARLITPLRRVVRIAAGQITTWIVDKELARENVLQVDEFRTLLAEVADEGVLDATERVLIDNLLEAGETEIVEIMTPRTRVKFLEDDMSVPEIVERFRDIRHPRVPVCDEQHDALVGFVHAEDILRLVLDDADLGKPTL